MQYVSKTLFDLLEGVRTWKLLKGGVEKEKVRKVKKGGGPIALLLTPKIFEEGEQNECETITKGE